MKKQLIKKWNEAKKRAESKYGDQWEERFEALAVLAGRLIDCTSEIVQNDKSDMAKDIKNIIIDFRNIDKDDEF